MRSGFVSWVLSSRKMKTRDRGLQSICHQAQNRFPSDIRTTSPWWADSGALISHSRFNLSRLLGKFVSRNEFCQITRPSSFGHTERRHVFHFQKFSSRLLFLYYHFTWRQLRYEDMPLENAYIELFEHVEQFRKLINEKSDSICNYLFIIPIPQHQQSVEAQAY